MTEFSGGYGEKWDGNSILLRIGDANEFRYVYIGCTVFEFTADEKVIKYVSSVGNNCVPYPYAESLNWCYSMDDMSRTPVSDHKNRETVGCVSYKNAEYESLNVTEIATRDIENKRNPVCCSEKTGYTRFNEPSKFCFMKNTCADENLVAVQYVNDMLSEQISTNSVQ